MMDDYLIKYINLSLKVSTMEQKTKKALDQFLSNYILLPINPKVIVLEGISGSGKTTYISNHFLKPNNIVISEIRINPGKFSYTRQLNMLSLNIAYEYLAIESAKNPLIRKVVFDRNFWSTLAYTYSYSEPTFIRLLNHLSGLRFLWRPKYVYMKKDISDVMACKREPVIIRDPVLGNMDRVARIIEFYEYIFSPGKLKANRTLK